MEVRTTNLRRLNFYRTAIIDNIFLGKLLQAAPHGVGTRSQRIRSLLELPYKYIDVLKAFSATKVAEEERAQDASITECLAATSTSVQHGFGKFFKAQL